MNSIKLGKTTIYSVSDGYIEFIREAFFPSINETEWEAYPEYSNGIIQLNIGSFIIKTETDCILVDTGLGKLDHHINQPIRETLISEILETGLSLDDISIVFMTHLHLDHVGTNMTKTETGWAPTFKNAKYMVSKEDWDLFSRLTDSKQFEYIKEQVTPLIDLGIISFFSGETYISDEVITFPTPGHTPGHTSLIIKSGNETAVVLGDSAHIPPQVEETHWSPKADRNSSLSEQSRQKIMKYIEENGSIIASGHFPSPGFGTIITQNNKNTYQTL